MCAEKFPATRPASVTVARTLIQRAVPWKSRPQKFLRATEKTAAPKHRTVSHSLPQRPTGDEKQTAYVFPMCPEVRRASKPGACRRCGMALKPNSLCPPCESNTPARCTRKSCTPGPGSCPICGMALEPRTVTAGRRAIPELREMTRRFWISLALTAPAAHHRHGGHASGNAGAAPRSHRRLLEWFELALATPVVLWGGWPFFRAAGRRSSTAASTCSP